MCALVYIDVGLRNGSYLDILLIIHTM